MTTKLLIFRRGFCAQSVVVAAALWVLAGCGQQPSTDRVVVYTSVDRIFSEPVLRKASEDLGLEVIGVYDTEETKSTGLVNRLLARRDSPDGDIFWSGDPARAALLKSQGITESYDSPTSVDIPSHFKDEGDHWIGFSARARVLLVNTDMVLEGDEPKSIFDLTKPEWKGRVAIANPLFGTTSFHVAALFDKLGDERAKQWFDDLKTNDVSIVSSNGEVKRQVASGQLAVGLTDSDDAGEAMKDGAPVRSVLLDQGGTDPLGNLVMPNTVSLIRNGPNPEGARKVVDYLLGSSVQRMLAESCAQAPLSPGVDAPGNVVSLDTVVPMNVNYSAVADKLEEIMPYLKEWAESR